MFIEITPEIVLTIVVVLILLFVIFVVAYLIVVNDTTDDKKHVSKSKLRGNAHAKGKMRHL